MTGYDILVDPDFQKNIRTYHENKSPIFIKKNNLENVLALLFLLWSNSAIYCGFCIRNMIKWRKKE